MDEFEHIERRLPRLRSRSGDPMVNHLGRSIITPILLIAHLEKYGVLNTVSQSGFRELNLWPDLDRGTGFANRYLAINEILQRLASRLEVDLWTLDAL